MAELSEADRAGGDGLASATDSTPEPLTLPGQPRNPTMALTIASMSSDAATRIVVVPKLEM